MQQACRDAAPTRKVYCAATRRNTPPCLVRQSCGRCIAVPRLPEITEHAAQQACAVGSEGQLAGSRISLRAPNPQLSALVDTLLAANWTLFDAREWEQRRAEQNLNSFSAKSVFFCAR